MTRFLAIFCGALLVGSIGAFFLFVPPLLISSVALILTGFLLMFILGVQVGSQSILLAADTIDGKPLPPQL